MSGPTADRRESEPLISAGANATTWVVQTFVELASMLITDFDLFEVLSVLTERCSDLLGAAEVGLLLADPEKGLRVMASSTERMHALELYEIQSDEGPCLDVFHHGGAVLNATLASSATRWPLFSASAREAGYETVHALPMRHRDQVVGVINIFHGGPAILGAEDAVVAQALADIATFAIMQDRALRRATELAEQLQGALQSRVIVEQAKGAISERLQIDIAVAFRLLREYSQNQNAKMADVASRVLQRELTAQALVEGARRT